MFCPSQRVYGGATSNLAPVHVRGRLRRAARLIDQVLRACSMRRIGDTRSATALSSGLFHTRLGACPPRSSNCAKCHISRLPLTPMPRKPAPGLNLHDINTIATRANRLPCIPVVRNDTHFRGHSHNKTGDTRCASPTCWRRGLRERGFESAKPGRAKARKMKMDWRPMAPMRHIAIDADRQSESNAIRPLSGACPKKRTRRSIRKYQKPMRSEFVPTGERARAASCRASRAGSCRSEPR